MKNSFSKNNLFPIFLLLSNFLVAQDASFFAPDTVCQNEIFELEYTGTGGESFCWISSPVFGEVPFVNEVVDFPEETEALYSKMIKDKGNYFLFVSLSSPNNGGNGNLMRLDFGNSLQNEPTANVVIDNEIPWGQEGIEIVKEGENWWGFIIGFGHLVRVNFGNDITNNPSIEDLGNLGGLSFPHDIFITKENDEWVGFCVDKLNNSVVRFLFGNSVANFPIIELVPSNNINGPTSIFPIKVEGEWHLFICNEGNNSITRLDFGNSILGNPTTTNLGDFGLLNQPRDLSIFYACNQYCGFVINRTESKIIKLDFSSDIKNIPNGIPLNDQSVFSFPHSISEGYLSEDGLRLFITSLDTRNLSELVFPFDVADFFICKNDSTPPSFSYANFGIQPLFLIQDEGTPFQTSDCKQVVVLPAPELFLGNDTSLCDGNMLILESDFSETIWQGNEIAASFEVLESGIYTAEISDENCTTYDSIEIVFLDCEKCFDIPNAFTPDGDQLNDTFSPQIKCFDFAINYQLQIFNRWGEMVFKTENMNEAWDGKKDGKAQSMDVFVWKLIYSFEKNGKVITKVEHGDVSLIR